MSDLKSVQCLREWAKHIDDNPHLGVLTSIGVGGLNAIANGIEDEIAERYIELPVDRDCVPLHIGDMVIEESDRIPTKVMSLTLYEDCWDVNSCGIDLYFLRHYHAPTVEDVLREFVNAYERESKHVEFDTLDFVEEYAEKLRKVIEDER